MGAVTCREVAVPAFVTKGSNQKLVVTLRLGISTPPLAVRPLPHLVALESPRVSGKFRPGFKGDEAAPLLIWPDSARPELVDGRSPAPKSLVLVPSFVDGWSE
jgi:hypothetical protein